MNRELNEIGVIIVLILFGTGGNILFRLNNHLKIIPLYIRFLMGVMTATIYITFFLLFLKRDPVFKYHYLPICFLVGYFVEILLDEGEKLLPIALEFFTNRFTGGKKDDKKRKE